VHVTISGSGHAKVELSAFIKSKSITVGTPTGVTLYDEPYEKIWWQRTF
jgi:hypothetical protein